MEVRARGAGRRARRLQNPRARALSTKVMLMNKFIDYIVAGSSLLLCVGALVSPAAAQTALSSEDLTAIWNDPTFQKQFIGSYGINADVEPRVTPDEVKILEKVRPLMAKELPKAEAALIKAMKPDCSAILDYTLAGIQFQQDRMDDAL